MLQLKAINMKFEKLDYHTVVRKGMLIGSKAYAVIPDFSVGENLTIERITFVIDDIKQSIKCILYASYIDRFAGKTLKEMEAGIKDKRLIRARGVAKRHPDDKWDERIGKQIAFAKAMADLFQISNSKLFGNGRY